MIIIYSSSFKSDGADLQRQGGVKFSFLVKQHAVNGALAAHFARTACGSGVSVSAVKDSIGTDTHR